MGPLAQVVSYCCQCQRYDWGSRYAIAYGINKTPAVKKDGQQYQHSLTIKKSPMESVSGLNCYSRGDQNWQRRRAREHNKAWWWGCVVQYHGESGCMNQIYIRIIGCARCWKCSLGLQTLLISVVICLKDRIAKKLAWNRGKWVNN